MIMNVPLTSRLVYLLFSVLIITTEANIEETPLCRKCSCTSDDSRSEVDIDCTEVILNLDFVHNQNNWINPSTNDSYLISILNLKSSDLGSLRGQFPSSNLSVLDLSENFIRTIDDEYFSKLQNMSTLILSNNEIDRLKPLAFKGLRMEGDNYPLRSLKTLKLDNNRLHTLDQDLFEYLEERLEVLDLSHNPIKVIDQQTTTAIGSIIYLKELYLKFTELKKLPEHFLHTPKYLKVLDLTGNNFKEVPEVLSDSHDLEVLYFNNNPIKNLTKERSFPAITTLKVLYMCNMLELEAIGEKSMSGLTNLTELHICNNMLLNKIDPGALTREEFETEILPPIEKLDLSNNKLTSLDRHLILNWENIKELDLRHNPWTCECENQWMVNVLMPIYLKINESLAKELKCEAPIEMVGKSFYDEYSGNKSMRCLDGYGNRPERDGIILIGVLVGLLLGIPIILFMIFAYQRHWFGLFDTSPAAFSRQFYSRTRSQEEHF